MEQEEWKEGNFLPVVCGTESSAVVPVLSFSSGTEAKSKVSNGNDTGAAHTGEYIWPVIEKDWADAKDGGLEMNGLWADFPDQSSSSVLIHYFIRFLFSSSFQQSACLWFPH